MSRTKRYAVVGPLACLGAVLYAVLPYLYARYANNYFHATALDYVLWDFRSEFFAAALNNYYPPIYFWFRSLLMHALNLTYAGMTAASVVFVLSGAWYIHRTGAMLFNKAHGITAAVAYLLFPGTAMLLSSTVREAPLALFVPGTIYYLFRSHGFRYARYAVAAGVMAGLGLLTKWTFPVYVIGLAPLLIAEMVSGGLEQTQRPAGRIKPVSCAKGCLLFALSTFLVAGWWYVGVLNLQTLVVTAKNDPSIPIYSYPDMLTHIARMFGADLLRWVWLAVAGAGLLVGMIINQKRSPALTFALCAAAALLILAFPIHAEERYYFPALPWIALLAGLPVAAIKSRKAQAIAATLILAVGLGYYLDTFLGDRWFPKSPPDSRLERFCDYYQVGGRLPWIPDRGSQRLIDKIVDHKTVHHPDRRIAVMVIAYQPDPCQLEPHALRIESRLGPSQEKILFHYFGGNLIGILQQDDPFYFAIREDFEPFEAPDNPEPPFLDVFAGEVLYKPTFAKKMAFRELIQTHVPLIDSVDMPRLGTIGIHYVENGQTLIPKILAANLP